jgi:23S rRNA (cytidine1920-2'-O)/16S rRNA (cytidine1409-2'-O)-methyltransferase
MIANNNLRLDAYLVSKELIDTRSQAEQEIRFGNVAVNGKIVTKTAYRVKETDKVRLIRKNPYVSRAGLKLASVARALNVDFSDNVVLDVGSSTGGFTDYALQNGATSVIAVDVGTDQLHPTLRTHKRVEVHEQTDIRDFKLTKFNKTPTVAVIDVSFISLRHVLPPVKKLVAKNGVIIAMCKPQFEAGRGQMNKGVIKNAKIRRDILVDFEQWLKSNDFVIKNKADSQVEGEKGNLERFYLLT